MPTHQTAQHVRAPKNALRRLTRKAILPAGISVNSFPNIVCRAYPGGWGNSGKKTRHNEHSGIFQGCRSGQGVEIDREDCKKDRGPVDPLILERGNGQWRRGEKPLWDGLLLLPGSFLTALLVLRRDMLSLGGCSICNKF